VGLESETGRWTGPGAGLEAGSVTVDLMTRTKEGSLALHSIEI
jgi:hypothetical protein